MKIKDQYSLISGQEMLEKLSAANAPNIQDFTNHGKCRDCGNCCGNYIPLTEKDVSRIRKYIREHGIKPVKPLFISGPWARPTMHNQCPFLLDRDGHRCAIYPVRPEVCRRWSCHDPMNNKELEMIALRPDLVTVNMYLEFYREETITELRKAGVEGI